MIVNLDLRSVIQNANSPLSSWRTWRFKQMQI